MPLSRRRFLSLAAGLALPGLAGCDAPARWRELGAFLRGLGIPLRVYRPGRAEGHRLRAGVLPAPEGEVRCEVAILGSGVAGLTAAWRLARAGRRDVVLLSGPEPDGNAAAVRFSAPKSAETLAAPRGAHYLPLPSPESSHVREMLADLGILRGPPQAALPEYDEAALVHAPAERVWLDGAWHDELLPEAPLSPAARAQRHRFLARLEALAAARGRDGRKVFALPVALSSSDPDWRALDTRSFAAWLAREGYTEPALLAYLDYACRDDFGAGIAAVSAWAGLHYFASRTGRAANAEAGAVLTWPEGLQRLTAGLAARLPAGCRRAGHALRLEEGRDGVAILCRDGAGRAYTLRARRAVCAMPLHVAARVMPRLADYGFDPRAHMPEHAPWLVGNLLMRGFPAEGPGAPLAWDNVVHGSPALGWVVSTHQDLRAARPAHTVFTTYRALADDAPQSGRRWLERAGDLELLDLALADLTRVYGPLDLWRHLAAVELTLRGHAMAIPRPGFLANPGLLALREADGPVLFAHSDLSGYSVFEEAAWWGDRAARRILG